MNTYRPVPKAQKNNPIKTPAETVTTGEDVKIDGYGQVLDMLKVADNEFRASILKRLAQKDPRLAAALKKEIDLWTKSR